jgi:hypothetical protein
MKKLITIAATRTLLILTFLSSLHASALIANPSHGSSKNTVEVIPLAPVTPRVADFNDGLPMEATFLGLLAPTTPKEALFDEEDSDTGLNQAFVKELAPVMPREADFEDTDNVPAHGIDTLKPNIPSEATFADF